MMGRLLLATFAFLAVLVPSADAALPTADFRHEPAEPRVGQEVWFYDQSTDLDGDIVNWTWSFPDGTELHGANVSYVFASSGVYTVTLTIRDSIDTSSSIPKDVPVGLAFEPDRLFPPWLYWLMPLLVSGILFTLGYIVVSKGQPAVYNLVFFLLYLASGIKSLTEAFIILVPDSTSLVERGAFLLNSWAAYVFAPLFLWFVLVFPRPAIPWFNEGRRGAVVLVLAVPFLLGDLLGLWSYQDKSNIFNVYVAFLTLSCLGILVYHSWEIDSQEERSRIRMLSVSFFILVFSTLVLMATDIAANVMTKANDPSATNYVTAQIFYGLFLLPVLEIVSAILLLYAILRYQLLGIDRLVKKITRNGVVGITLPAIFIILGNVIEEIFQSTVLATSDLPVPFIIAGFIATFFMIPIQKWVTFLTNKWFPSLESADELSQRRMEIYEAQLRYHLLDGALSDKEYRILRRLRDEVQLLPHEVEMVVKRFPGVELAPLQTSSLAALAQSATAS